MTSARVPGRASGVRRCPPARLRLEVLEYRLTPTVITVNTNLDVVAADGKFSVREAIEAANGNAAVFEEPAGQGGGLIDRIRFSSAVFGKTITLDLGFLFVTEGVTIQGPGARR